MKRLLFLILLLPMLAVAQQTNKTPINRGMLQSDLDGNGKSGTNFGTLKATNFIDAVTGLPITGGGAATTNTFRMRGPTFTALTNEFTGANQTNTVVFSPGFAEFGNGTIISGNFQGSGQLLTGVQPASTTLSNVTASAFTTNAADAAFTIITPGASTATIQAAFNTGGTIEFQRGTYTISNIIVTAKVHVKGNHSIFVPSAGITNFLFDTGTGGAAGSIYMEDMILDGGLTGANFNSAAYFSLQAGLAEPYYNANYTNKSGMRLEVSKGGSVFNCEFKRWAGNGLVLINTNNQNSQDMQRMAIYANHFYSNFCGLDVVGPNYGTAAYYNNPGGGWVSASDEYQCVSANELAQNYIGLNDPAGNAQVVNDMFTDNYIHLLVGSAVNAAHGLYSLNTFNHAGGYGVWLESNNGGIVSCNTFLANPVHLIGNAVTDLQFNNNFLGAGSALIVTNGSTGTIKNSFYQGVWGTDITTNYSSGVRVSGGQSEAGGDDGSPIGMTERLRVFTGIGAGLTGIVPGGISLSQAALIGRSSAGVGQEITIGSGLSLSGTTLTATASGGGGTNSGPITLLATNNQVNIPMTCPVGVSTNSILPFRLTLTNNFTITNATGMADGQKFELEVIQNGTGNWTLSFWNGFTNGSPANTSYGTNSFSRNLTGVNISTNSGSISTMLWKYYAPSATWMLRANDWGN